MDPSDLLDRISDAPLHVVLPVMLGLCFFDALAIVGIVLPGDLLLLVPAGAQGPDGAWAVFLASVLGTMLGFQVSFAIGRVAGPRVRRSWLGRRIGDRRWRHAVLLLQGPAARALVAVQFLPVFNCIIPLLAGSLQVPRWRFLKYTLLGSVAYAAIYVALGSTAGHAGEQADESRGQVVALLAVALPAVLTSTFVLTRAARKLAREADPLLQDADGAKGGDGPDRGDGMDGGSRDVRDSITC